MPRVIDHILKHLCCAPITPCNADPNAQVNANLSKTLDQNAVLWRTKTTVGRLWLPCGSTSYVRAWRKVRHFSVPPPDGSDAGHNHSRRMASIAWSVMFAVYAEILTFYVSKRHYVNLHPTGINNFFQKRVDSYIMTSHDLPIDPFNLPIDPYSA